MKKLVCISLLLLITAISTICSAAQVPLLDTDAAGFVAECNKAATTDDGDPLLNEPKAVPTKTETNETPYVTAISTGNTVCSVIMYENTDKKVSSISIITDPSLDSQSIAVGMAQFFSEVIGLSESEDDDIFGSTNERNMYTTWCRKLNRRVVVANRVLDAQGIYVIIINASDIKDI